MKKSKGIKFLVLFIVFLLPFIWYVSLHVFGQNKFDLSLLKKHDDRCGEALKEIIVVTRDTTFLKSEENAYNLLYSRMKLLGIAQRKYSGAFFKCYKEVDAKILLINPSGVWGSYELSREGVELLIEEVHILIGNNQ